MSTILHRPQFVHNPLQLNAAVWKACAGTSVHIPTVNSRVYYFPQGHLEQSSPSISFPFISSPPSIPCRVLNVLLLADPDTDEVFAKIRLQPLLIPSPSTRFDFYKHGSHSNDDVIVSFSKVLTPSDANNGGGFSVPRFCADLIFPPLDYAADPPVQNLRIADLHGECFEFRHIYRGTPRRHLLTTGWSKFVNSKKLIAGDSVVFIRNKVTKELFVGVRRAVKSNEGHNWGPHCGAGVSVGSTGGGGGGFTRNGKGRVPAEAVIEAVERASSNMMFEVVYYPRGGLPEYVVDAEKVERAMRVFWSSGMRVKMAVETEDSSRMTWFQGTVASLVGPHQGTVASLVGPNQGTVSSLVGPHQGTVSSLVGPGQGTVASLVGPHQGTLTSLVGPHQGTFASLVGPSQGVWRGSMWRMLQVAWDEPEALQNMKTVNPWQVEVVAPVPPILTTSPPAKKFRPPPLECGQLTDGEGDIPLLMTSHLSSSFLNYNIPPASMQGARQKNPFFLSTLPNINIHGALHMCADDCMEDTSQKVGAVSTDLNIWNNSPCDASSLSSQNGLQLFGIDSTENISCNLSRKVGITSFQLFGKIIHMEQPPMDDDSCAKFDDFATGVTRKSMDHSLSNPCKNLHNRLGAQQRSSVTETYAL